MYDCIRKLSLIESFYFVKVNKNRSYQEYKETLSKESRKERSEERGNLFLSKTKLDDMKDSETTHHVQK